MRRFFPFLLILAVALALRLIALTTIPPGLQHDEVFHGHDAVTVLLGERPLYFTSNAGNEPLFIYLMAITVGLLGHNELGIRLAAVICGMLTVVFTYLWIRRAFNQRTALIAAALLAVNFWPLFLSRVGLRAASVPMMAALAAWLLFRGIEAPPISSRQRSRYVPFVIAGVALGLALYTYPAARTLPVIVVLFWLLESIAARRINRPLLVTLITAAVVFAPLGYTLATLPQADLRLQQLSAPLQAALNGDFGPVLRYTLDTVGMFSFGGDPIARYNLPGRPVFDPITSALFYAGLLLALSKWREPRQRFALLWLPIGLLPSMLSDAAPSFLRASASLPVTFLFPALALEWLAARFFAAWRLGMTLLVVAVIGLNGVLTIHAYFEVWPNRSDVREVYRTDLALAAKWIEQQPADEPIIVAGTNPRDLDPFLFDFQLPTKHDVRWVDRAFSIVFPARSGLLISPVYSPLDPALRDRFLPSPQATIAFADGAPAFEVFDLTTPPRLPISTMAAADDGALLTAPIRVGEALDFLGYEAASSAKACEWAHFWMVWRVAHDVDAQQLPLSLFVHLLDEHGELKVGRDLLGYPTAGWRAGDVWVQQNDLQLPCGLEPGMYQLEIGAYSYADNVRWRIFDATGVDRGDRLLLSRIVVQPQ